jgi:Domain of unknown function (DUF5666)
MKTKDFLSLLAVAVVLGGIIGGALAGGIAIGKNQGRQEARQGLQSQSGQFSSTASQGNATQSPGNYTGIPSGASATVGTVEKVEGNSITLNTRTGTVLVYIGNSISIQKTCEGTLSDISSGERISVAGQQNADGSIEARNISTTAEFQGQFGQFTPPFGQGNATQLPGNYTGIPSGVSATVGTVEKVEGSLITLSTSTGTVLVHVDNSTSIQKMCEGTLSDISVGERITVAGQQRGDGSIDANNISITRGFAG